MNRWLVSLNGEKFDLEEFPLAFPSGALHAICDDMNYFLTGDYFEQFQDAVPTRCTAEGNIGMPVFRRHPAAPQACRPTRIDDTLPKRNRVR